MNKIFLTFLPFVLFSYLSAYSAEPSKTQLKKKESHEHGAGEDHDHEGEEHGDEDKDHEEGHEHGAEEEGEGGPRVGPDKGILEASEHNGFKLSPEAIKNFGLAYTKLSGAGPWNLPKSALLFSGEERNIFRVRDGFFKRIDFDEKDRSDQMITIQSKELKDGDEIVVQGLGFLRIAELTAFGSAPEGHHH